MKNVTGYARILEDDLADVSFGGPMPECFELSESIGVVVSQHAIITKKSTPGFMTGSSSLIWLRS